MCMKRMVPIAHPSLEGQSLVAATAAAASFDFSTVIVELTWLDSRRQAWGLGQKLSGRAVPRLAIRWSERECLIFFCLSELAEHVAMVESRSFNA